MNTTTINVKEITSKTASTANTILKEMGIGAFTRMRICNLLKNPIRHPVGGRFTDNVKVVYINRLKPFARGIVSSHYDDQLKIGGLSIRLAITASMDDKGPYRGPVLIIAESCGKLFFYKGTIEENGDLICSPCSASITVIKM